MVDAFFVRRQSKDSAGSRTNGLCISTEGRSEEGQLPARGHRGGGALAGYAAEFSLSGNWQFPDMYFRKLTHLISEVEH